jgi:hypothetical protein
MNDLLVDMEWNVWQLDYLESTRITHKLATFVGSRLNETFCMHNYALSCALLVSIFLW